MPELLRSQPEPPLPFPRFSWSSIYYRFATLALLLVSELIAVTIWLDTASLSRNYVVARFIGDWGAWILRAVVVFASIFLAFGYLRAKPVLMKMDRTYAPGLIRLALLAGHFGSLAVFGFLSRILFGGNPAGWWTNGVGLAWAASGLLAVVLACMAFLPLENWLAVLRSTGNTWAYAAGMAMLAGWLGNLLRMLWGPATRATFRIVQFMLSLCLARVISNPASATIGSPTFQVTIDKACSGLEGVGLMLAFGILWLWFFRQDFRFPQAILLVPVSLLTAFLLNSARIATLVLIGNAGAPSVAVGGFHSQAGWIAFNAVALGLVLGSQKVRWISKQPRAKPNNDQSVNPIAVYLAPFLAILAAGMLSRAATGEFEWLYPLRLFAALGVLWFYRKKLAGMNWGFGWLGPAAGVAVFAFWIALDRFTTASAHFGTVPGLTPGHDAAWLIWLVLRTLGAVVTVPVAEELAFRGFLLRGLVSADFESVDFRATSVFALLGSSLAFGLMHGARWFAGTLAGLVYALVLRRRGRIGEAVVAHAVTNALLAVWVITRGDWGLW